MVYFKDCHQEFITTIISQLKIKILKRKHCNQENNHYIYLWDIQVRYCYLT